MIEPELFALNAAGVFCATIILLLGIFVLVKAHKKVSHILFFLLTLSVVSYYAGHLLGINASDAKSAEHYFMFLLSDIFIVIFSIHFVYEVFGQKTKSRLLALWTTYGIGIPLFIYFILNPEMFMGLPHSKLYLPYYYVPGQAYIVFNIYFLICSIYVVYDLWRCYRNANNIEKNRAKYMFIGFLYGYVLGSTAFLLVFDIPVDPIYAIFCGLYTIPFAYSFLSYELLDVQVVAKKAFVYTISVAVVGIAVVFINSANDFIVSNVKGLSPLIIPLFSSAAVVVLAIFVWHRIREVDKLKYEFVTVITHKFRTPLTYIKWSMEKLLTEKLSEEERRKTIAEVQIACERLGSLTDILGDLEKSESVKYSYQFVLEDASSLVREVIGNNMKKIGDKHISLTTLFPDKPIIVSVDKGRFEFAFQVILENAIRYTPDLGTIYINVRDEGDEVTIKCKDSGIGINKDDLPFVFTKFFRSHDAQNKDTEGMGVGLFIAKNILKKHGGDVKVDSEGRDHGSSFTVILPKKK